jgi:hypothetical protein
MYKFVMITWNTQLQSYQQRVHKNTLTTVKCQTQQAENTTPAMIISVEVAHSDDAIILDYLTCEVALEEPGIGSTDPNIPTENNCTDDELHLGMTGAAGLKKIKLTKLTSAIRSPLPACDGGLCLHR